jgi:hypothetical protein
MLGYWFGTLRIAMRLRYTNPTAAALGAGVIVWMAVGAVNNPVTDRFLYVPVAALLAMASVGWDAGVVVPGHFAEAGMSRVE